MSANGNPHGLRVGHLGDDRFSIDVRGHRLTVDQPESDGGSDSAPTPTELFVAGLASCVGFYARRYLARHGLPFGGLGVRATWSMASRPTRVGAVDIRVDLPEGVPVEHRDRLLAVASHCTVHNSLSHPPGVSVTLAGDAADDQRGAA